MKLKITLPILLLLNCFFNYSCSSDAPTEEETTQSLIGKWELNKGFRGGKEAVTLAGTSFEFLSESKMVYNLAGAREEVEYDLNELTIQPKASRLKASYLIEELTDSTLVLSTSIRETPFRFELNKAVIEE